MVLVLIPQPSAPFHVAVGQAGLAAAHAADASHALRRHRRADGLLYLLHDVGCGVGFAAVGDIAIAVGEVGVAAGDATVAGGAAGRAIGDPRQTLPQVPQFAALTAVSTAAIHGARFAGPVAPGTHRRGAATCRARDIRGRAGRALVAAVARSCHRHWHR